MTDEPGAELTCRELTEVVTDYLEGAMPAEDRARFDAHLELCEGCVNAVSQMRETSGRSASWTRPRPRRPCPTTFRGVQGLATGRAARGDVSVRAGRPAP